MFSEVVLLYTHIETHTHTHAYIAYIVNLDIVQQKEDSLGLIKLKYLGIQRLNHIYIDTYIYILDIHFRRVS